MEIPKEVKVFETYERAKRQFKEQYVSNRQYLRLLEEKLNIICPVDLKSIISYDKKAYCMMCGFTPASECFSEGNKYYSVKDTAEGVKRWLQTKSVKEWANSMLQIPNDHNAEIVPFLYTIYQGRTLPPLEEDIFQTIDNLVAGEQWNKLIQDLGKLAVVFDGINPAEREEFKKAFFTG
ncbi:MAG: hypothetical protein V1734_04130 [Nanoarchaeota archaeon]